jgi:hypothetical protein
MAEIIDGTQQSVTNDGKILFEQVKSLKSLNLCNRCPICAQSLLAARFRKLQASAE